MVHTKKIRIRNFEDMILYCRQTYVRCENKDDIFGELKYSNRINNSLALNKVLSEIVLGKNNE